MELVMAWIVIAATMIVTLRLLSAPPEQRYGQIRPRSRHR